MDISGISYNYDSKYLIQSLKKIEPNNSIATSFINLIKFVDSTSEKREIQNFDFAGNFPSMFSFINSITDSLLRSGLVQLYQAALSKLTNTCRNYKTKIKQIEMVPKLEDFSAALFETTNKVISKSESIPISTNSSSHFLQDKKQSKNYIIKRLKANFETSESQKLLLSKIFVYSKINYYSIIPFEGFTFYYKDGTKDYSPAIIIKYQKEKTLKDVLFNSPLLNDTQKMILLLGICSGMKYLHQYKILHGNLKLSSIYVNNELEPFLTDFYYETLNAKDPIDIRYIAPENYPKTNVQKASSIHNLSNNSIALKADVYSFAMIAYSILTSQLPFGKEAQQPQQLMQMVLKGQRPQFPSYVPDNFVRIISKCWDSDPAKRPSFQEIIGNLLENESALYETDMKLYSKYINKILPDYRAPTVSLAACKSTSGNIQTRSLKSSKLPSFDEDEKTIDFDDTESVFELALRLFNTNDRNPDKIALSIKYIKNAANKGLPEAQVEYGKILLEGNQDSSKPVPKNAVEAAFYFRLAADSGNIDGQYWYGRCLYYGMGVEQNYTEAAKYLHQSAKQGNRDAQYLYGLCLKEGNGVPQNISSAIRYFQMAKENGEVASIRHLCELES